MAEPKPAGVVPTRPSPLATLVRAGVALAVTAFALWVSFRDVALGALLERLAGSDLGVVATYAAAQLVIHAVRVWRWDLLVRPLGTASGRAVFSAASVGIPAAMFLPLRLGELVRPAMIARSGVPFPSAMASVVTERIADGLANVGLFFVLLATMPASTALPDEVALMAKIALVGFGGACVVLVAMVVARGPALALTRRLLSPISEALAGRVVGLLEVFIQGLAPLYQPTRLAGFLASTAIYWALNGLTTTMLARSYGLDVPLVAGPFAVVIVVFAVTLPAGPAFAGVLQMGYRLGLAPFGVDANGAALVAISAHLVQIAVQASIMGVGFLAAEPAQRRKGDAAAEVEDPAPGR